MAELLDLAMVNQREIEKLFAASAYAYPLYTIQNAGWLDPAILTESKIKAFWVTLRERLGGIGSDESAQTIAIQAAMELDMIQDIGQWARILEADILPQALAGEIARRAYLVRMNVASNQLAAALMHGDDLKAREIINQMHGSYPESTNGALTVDEIDRQFCELIDKGGRAIPTQLSNLDFATGGMERQTLTVLAARPGMGKTALALQLARSTAATIGPVNFFSLEMSAVALWARMACPRAKVSWREVLSGRLTVEQRSLLKAVSAQLRQELPRLTIFDGRHTTESIWRTVGTLRPTLVIVDHIRFLKDKVENEVKRMGRVTENLHDIAKAFDVPVLALAQINRGNESRDDKRPQLSDLRDSGEIEENADNVWMMYREGYYKIESLHPEATEVILRKFRNGPAGGVVNLNFDAAAEWFTPKRAM